MKQCVILCFSVLCCIGFASQANAQWVSDTTKNTAICTAAGLQQKPVVCSDEADGVIVVWEDYRNNNFDVYAQKLNSDGIAQWTKDGVLLCNSTVSQSVPVVASDGSGGAFVAWKDARPGGGGTDLYAQHINSDGSLAYGATGSGIAVATDAAAPDHLAICSDGSGNAFVAWEDSRTSIAAAGRNDIWMNKLTAGGVAWGNTGLAVISTNGKQVEPHLVDDGTGGCILAYENQATVPSSIMAARVNNAGVVQWGTIGVKIFSGDKGTQNTSRNVNVRRDGNQFLFSWETNNASNSSKGWNIYGQRLKLDSNRVWGTAGTASEISTDWVGNQINSIVFSDDSIESNGLAGLICIYVNDISTKTYIVMTRLLSNGSDFQPVFPNHIYTVCNQTNNQSAPVGVRTASGEVLTAWVDGRLGKNSIYAQRVDRLPKRYLGYLPTVSSWGIPVSNRTNSDADQLVMVPRTNGGIAVWRDNRNGTTNTDIYAQLIFRDGTLPVELSSFTASATGNGNVVLNWQTVSEKDNAGFEIERRQIAEGASNYFEVVASYQTNATLRGVSFSNTSRGYSHIDMPGAAGFYEYRLVDVTLDGERTPHQIKRVELGSASGGITGVEQNMPNPFADHTLIPVTLASTLNVTVEISDVLGRTIATPYNNQALSAGSHDLRIDGSALGANGSYYCRVTMTDPNTGSVVWTSPKAMLIQLSR